MSKCVPRTRFAWMVLGPVMLAGPILATAEEPGWVTLIGDHELEAWRKPMGNWFVAGDARLDPGDPSRLSAVRGRGVLINGPTGRTRNLLTKQDFGDLEAHFEFLIPRQSNSGVKLQGLYEVQIVDSHGAKRLTGSECEAALKPIQISSL